MTHASKRTRYLLPTMFVAIIFSFTFSSYFYLRGATEESIRTILLEQYEQRQIDSTATLSKSVAADLDGIILRLELLASKPPLQRGELTGEETTRLLNAANTEINQMTLNDGIVLLNEDNIVSYSTNYPELVGIDASFRDYIIAAKQSLKPIISEGLHGKNGKFGVGIAVPIVSHENGRYLGMLVGALATQEFFGRYGNITNIDSQFLEGLDRNGAYFDFPATSHFVGENFFGEKVQSATHRNVEMNRIYSEALMSGRTAYGFFDTGSGERFAVAAPVVFRGNQVMTVVTSTPTFSIYSEIEKTLFAVKVQTVVLLAVAASAVSILVILLTRMNLVLQNAVKKRTNELESASAKLESLNSELELKNNQLIKSNKELAEKENALEKAMSKVLEADMEKEQFSAMITHELRTPLAPIIGYGSMFLHGKLGELPSIHKKTLQIMYDNARRLADLIQDILDAQKLELGALRLDINEASARNMIEESINSMNAQAEAKRIRLLDNLESELTLKCDSDRIIQVLTNLISNGLKFSPENGEIEIDAQLNDGYAVFSVKDKGLGIPKEKQSRLFTKFYQVDTSLTRKAGGTGLGLAICKGIVEAHYGKIWLESDAGKGSIFRFSIPIDRKLDNQENSSG